eukprot:448672_1
MSFYIAQWSRNTVVQKQTPPTFSNRKIPADRELSHRHHSPPDTSEAGSDQAAALAHSERLSRKLEHLERVFVYGTHQCNKECSQLNCSSHTARIRELESDNASLRRRIEKLEELRRQIEVSANSSGTLSFAPPSTRDLEIRIHELEKRGRKLLNN